MKNLEESLEFNRIEEELFTYFAFDESKISFSSSKMITSKLDLEEEHGHLKETSKFISSEEINLEHTCDLSSAFLLSSKGGILSIQELASFIPFLINNEILRIKLNHHPEYERLHYLSQDLKDFNYIKNRLSVSILPDLTLSDDASPLLHDIRVRLNAQLVNLSNAIKTVQGKYQSYLTDIGQTVRNGLPSLAVKSEFKNKVKGMVQDISNSGGTIYIVPIEILDIQNKIFTLREDEREEIQRIIKDLSSLIASKYEDLNKAYLTCVRLDSLIGRVKYGNSYSGNIAEISKVIYLSDLSHPLLDRNTVVRSTFSLGDASRKILVISGPNAGGKTVLIKAVTLACYMNQKGLLVSCLGECKLPIFKNIFFLSGDSQSIMDSLSTFSGHVESLKEGLEQVNSSSLFVVDEIGQGTSPNDGEAIGVATIDYLKKKGGYAILTSHYDGIKQKAYEDENCLVGAMIFDEETIKPTFRYQEGMIGRSYALEVSENMGLNKEIIDSARLYLKRKNKVEGKDQIEKAIALQQENLKQIEIYNKKIEEADKLLEKRQKALDGLTREKEAIASKAEDKLEEMILEKRKEIDALFKEHKISLKDLADIKGKLNEVDLSKNKNLGKYKKEEKNIKPPREFKIGDVVKVTSLNNSGEVTSINKSKNQISVKIGGIEFKLSPSDLVYMHSKMDKENPLEKKVMVADSYINRKTGVPLELNIIGLRQDEAKAKLIKYLDDCILLHFHQVRIIHGHGTGALRNMVRTYLSKCDNVESFRFGGEGEGGVGATVVILK